jgi:hypothetical protein
VAAALVSDSVRYLHPSGLSLGFRLPLLGFFRPDNLDAPRPPLAYFLGFLVTGALSLPLVTVGWRF